MGPRSRTEVTGHGTGPIETIHLGEYAVRDGDAEIRTLLGSCVCVCLWDPVTRLGGANHFQLPEASSTRHPARFGIHAMELLINQMMSMGADRRRFRALAFGGAAISESLGSHGVGDRNVRFATDFLSTEGIPLVGGDLGGTAARRVYFRVSSGVGRVRRLPASTAPAVEPTPPTRPTRPGHPAPRTDTSVAGDVVLF